MSTMSDYYAPDETPEERDPTPEEMMPVEEQLLDGVERALNNDLCFWSCALLIEREARSRTLGLLMTLRDQAIADRDAPEYCSYDTDGEFADPFSDEALADGA